jgi:ABC-type transport system involved in multi-copper enzyme maturation permease subunit
MLMGPVFRAELLRTARRGRYYILRLVYGAILLLLIWSGYEQTFLSKRTASIAAVAIFAEETFFTFAIVQLVTVLVLIPPIFGGTIADEKQRKTLHYLMASQLSGGEIVVDKALGRLPHLAVFVAIGLPVVSILGLFGGVPAEYVAVAYIGTATSCAFAVALTVLVSTLARRVRQAVLAAYVLLFSWLFVPTLVELIGSRLRVVAYQWVEPVNTWLVESSPFGALIRVAMRGRPGLIMSPATADFQWMAGLQVGGAALLLLLAVWRLRPTFRHQEETPARRAWFRSARSRRRPSPWFARPECGVDAVLWKERYFAPADIFTRMVLLPAIVFITLPLALMTEVEGDFIRAISDLWASGFSARYAAGPGLARALQVDLGWYTALWLLAIAGAAASSVTIEREEDTWVSLTSTPLSGWQILRAKVVGALWNQRGFAAVLGFVWFVGLLTGALRPRAVLASVALVGVLSWLVVAVGIHASLQATSTSRAIVSTIVALCLFNGYPFILVFWFCGFLHRNASVSLLGFMPWLAVTPLGSLDFVDERWWRLAKPFGFYVDPTDFVPIGRLVLLVGYLVAAVVLTWRVVGRFDDQLDRPRA